MRFGHWGRHREGGHCGGGMHGGGFGRGPFGGGWAAGPEEGGRGFGGRGGGRQRRFGSSELRLVLLKLIADEPRHGYDLIRAVEDATGGAYAPSPGVIYPTLTLLQDQGLIEEQAAEGARRVFGATAAGRDELARNADEVLQLFARLQDLADRAAQSDAGPVKRAMANLHMVLRERLSRREVSDEDRHAIVELLDDVARRIERM